MNNDEKEVKKIPLLKPNTFSKDDKNNPKVVDAAKKLEDARKKNDCL